MKKQFLLPPLAVFLCLFSGSLSAAVIPEHSEKDGRIQFVEYDPDNVVKIRAKIGHTVTVQVNENLEEKGYVTVGDTGAWKVTVRGNHLIFKPLATDPETNLTIITDKRTYVFDLGLAGTVKSKKGKKVVVQQPTYLLRFSYPDEIAAAKLLAAKRQARALQLRLKYGLNGSKTPLNYLYYGKGDKKIAPTTIWDDSNFTYLQYADNRDLPTVYKVNTDGKEMLVNYRVEDDTMVIQETAEQFVIRLGDSVLGIRNAGYKVGKFNHLNTNSNDAVRLIKGEE